MKQKLIQVEVEKILESADKLESILGLPGSVNEVKDSVMKFFSGSKDVQDWYKVLHENFKTATILIPNPNEINVTRNGITVVVKQDSNKKWNVVHNGMNYPVADAKDLISKVKSYTEQGTPAAADAQDILRYSRAILKCKASPGAVHF